MLRNFFGKVFPKIISARAHSVIDYAYVGGNLLAAAILRKKNPVASNAAAGLAVAGLLNAVLTDYPLGVFRIYSLRAHAIVDYGISGAAEVIPKVLEFDYPAAKYFRVLSAGGILIAELSDYGDRLGAGSANHFSKRRHRGNGPDEGRVFA